MDGTLLVVCTIRTPTRTPLRWGGVRGRIGGVVRETPVAAGGNQPPGADADAIISVSDK